MNRKKSNDSKFSFKSLKVCLLELIFCATYKVQTQFYFFFHLDIQVLQYYLSSSSFLPHRFIMQFPSYSKQPHIHVCCSVLSSVSLVYLSVVVQILYCLSCYKFIINYIGQVSVAPSFVLKMSWIHHSLIIPYKFKIN